MPTTPTVLFVCLHGSAKSLMALEHFRRLTQERNMDVLADWAGIEPDAHIPPRVRAGTPQRGHRRARTSAAAGDACGRRARLMHRDVWL